MEERYISTANRNINQQNDAMMAGRCDTGG
jgi:hypothetical protein